MDPLIQSSERNTIGTEKQNVSKKNESKTDFSGISDSNIMREFYQENF